MEGFIAHIDEVLKTGFSSANVNLKSNKYAAGVHFVRDPRLAHFFVRELRSAGSVDIGCEKLLCRPMTESANGSFSISIRIDGENGTLANLSCWE